MEKRNQAAGGTVSENNVQSSEIKHEDDEGDDGEDVPFNDGHSASSFLVRSSPALLLELIVATQCILYPANVPS